MKTLLTAAILSLAFVGSASADYLDDQRYDISYVDQQVVRSTDFSNLPATAAGRIDNNLAQKMGGIVDGADNEL